MEKSALNINSLYLHRQEQTTDKKTGRGQMAHNKVDGAHSFLSADSRRSCDMSHCQCAHWQINQSVLNSHSIKYSTRTHVQKKKVRVEESVIKWGMKTMMEKVEVTESESCGSSWDKVPDWQAILVSHTFILNQNTLGEEDLLMNVTGVTEERLLFNLTWSQIMCRLNKEL